MPEQRKTIAKQLTTLIKQKVYTFWEEATDLLEPHDPHRVAFEGEEDAPIYDCEDGEDDDYNTDNDEPPDSGGGDGNSGDDDDAGCGGPPERGLSTRAGDYDSHSEGGTDAGHADDGFDGSGGMDGTDDGLIMVADDRHIAQETGLTTLGLTTPSEDSLGDAANVDQHFCREEAKKALEEECARKKKDALGRIAVIAEDAGEAAIARDTRERLRKLENKKPGSFQ